VNFAILAAASGLFGLFGNEGPPVPLVTSLAGRDCATTLDLSKATVLRYTGNESDIDAFLDPAAACVQTPAGPSLYHVYRLPDAVSPDLIAVTSKPFGAAILPPRVLLLDNAGTVKRQFAGADLAYHGTGLTARFRSHPDETYLVVESDSALIGSTVSRVTESTNAYIMPAGNGYFSVHTGNDQTTQFMYSYTGKLEIALEPLPKSN
jgi:hypothetical protein